MAKKIKALIKVQVTGGKATPAPPLGPALGQHGMNIAEFCQKINAATQDPVSELIKKAAKIPKGSAKPLTDKVGKITKAQVREIAEKKMPDLNCSTVEAGMRQVEGTARNMGVEVTA